MGISKEDSYHKLYIMRKTIILVLFTFGFSLINVAHTQGYKVHHAGYSAGEGQGASYIFERILDDSVVESGDFGAGIIINLRTQNIERGSRIEIIFGGRVAYHPKISENSRFDPYAFIVLGVGFEDINNDPLFMGTRVAEQTQFTAWGVGGGVRYDIFDRFGAFAEGSFGVGAITAGLYLKIFR